jgi:small subunit ribosomal protein S4
MIGGRKVTIPGYQVSRAEESQVMYAAHSPMANEVHPERARISKVGR